MKHTEDTLRQVAIRLAQAADKTRGIITSYETDLAALDALIDAPQKITQERLEALHRPSSHMDLSYALQYLHNIEQDLRDAARAELSMRRMSYRTYNPGRCQVCAKETRDLYQVLSNIPVSHRYSSLGNEKTSEVCSVACVRQTKLKGAATAPIKCSNPYDPADVVDPISAEAVGAN